MIVLLGLSGKKQQPQLKITAIYGPQEGLYHFNPVLEISATWSPFSNVEMKFSPMSKTRAATRAHVAGVDPSCFASQVLNVNSHAF